MIDDTTYNGDVNEEEIADIYDFEYPVNENKSPSLSSVECGIPEAVEEEEEENSNENIPGLTNLGLVEDDYQDQVQNSSTIYNDMQFHLGGEEPVEHNDFVVEQEYAEQMDPQAEEYQEEEDFVVDSAGDPFDILNVAKEDWIKEDENKVPLEPPMRPPPQVPPIVKPAKSKNFSLSAIKKAIIPQPDKNFGLTTHFSKGLIPNPKKGIKKLIQGEEKYQKKKEIKEIQKILDKGKQQEESQENRKPKNPEALKFLSQINAVIEDSTSKVSALLLKSELIEEKEPPKESGWAEQFEKEVANKTKATTEEFVANFESVVQAFPDQEVEQESDWAKEATEDLSIIKPSLEFSRDNWAKDFPKVEKKEESFFPEPTTQSQPEEDWSANFTIENKKFEDQNWANFT